MCVFVVEGSVGGERGDDNVYAASGGKGGRELWVGWISPREDGVELRYSKKVSKGAASIDGSKKRMGVNDG